MNKYFCTALIPLALLAGCSKDKTKNPSPDKGNFTLFHNDSKLIVTTQEGAPLPMAQILIGESEGVPFANNFLTTDENGEVAVPTEWAEELPVTIQAPGFVRLTYLGQKPGALTVALRRTPQRQTYEVRGTALNLPIKNKDGIVDFAMVMPAFSQKDIFNFNVNKIISPNTDTITQLGQEMYIPSNVSLPNQEERYAFFTITLDKPLFRLYLDQPGLTRLYAARGRFQFKPVAEALQGGASFYTIINEMKLTGGVIRDVDITAPQTGLNLPMQELNFTGSLETKTPPFKSDESFISLSLASTFGLMIPTDIKRPSSGQKQVLSTLPNSEQMFVGVLKKTADLEADVDRMSVAYLPLQAGMTPQVLPIIASPTLRSGELNFPNLTPVPGIHAIGTHAILSQEIEAVQGGAKVKINHPLWDVYAPAWSKGMKIPVWPRDNGFPGKKRWELSFFGSQKTSQVVLGPAMIENATHVTHSSVSF